MDAMNIWFASHPQLFLHPPGSNRPGCDSYGLICNYPVNRLLNKIEIKHHLFAPLTLTDPLHQGQDGF
jgi:hypothetical protein